MTLQSNFVLGDSEISNRLSLFQCIVEVNFFLMIDVHQSSKTSVNRLVHLPEEKKKQDVSMFRLLLRNFLLNVFNVVVEFQE